MDETTSFLHAILANPDDDVPRLAYADHLDSIKQCERATLIRVQCRLAKYEEGDPDCWEPAHEAEDILRFCRNQWMRELPHVDGIRWGAWERGFPATLELIDLAWLHQYADRFFAAAPIQTIHLRGASAGEIELTDHTLAPLVGWKYLSQIRRLIFPPRELNREEVEALFHSPELRLRELDATACRGGPAMARSLANSVGLRDLRALNLWGCLIGDIGIKALLDSRHLRNLCRLELGRNGLSIKGIRDLTSSSMMKTIQALELEEECPEDVVLPIAESWKTTDLRVLRLGFSVCPANTLRALTQSRRLAKLRVLNLTGAIGVDGARVIGTPSRLQALHTLSLFRGHVGDEGAIALAASPILATIQRLHLAENDITDRGAIALARSPHFGPLQLLNLLGNPIGEPGRSALRERFGHHVTFEMPI